MKDILSLSATEARAFLLKEDSYFSFELPLYFQFSQLLVVLSKKMHSNPLSNYYKISKGKNKNKPEKPEHFENVNYKLLNNKNGEYSWRLFQLIHPVLYVSLVHEITKRENWKTILNKFEDFKKNSNIECLSIPTKSENKNSDKAEQIRHWWQKVEQKSIELGLEYEYLFETDIVGCYDSIYTHSIAWALHSKKESKKLKNRNNNSLIGNAIDSHIRAMTNGQTNGIPQGSVLMDFIAEIVLGYGDELLTKKLVNIKDDFKIIRYRDDYKIFVNNPQIGKEIIKNLTEVMSELGMKLNPQKTKYSNDVIHSAIKPDKLYLITNDKRSNNIENELFIISYLAQKFPNSGIVSKLLQQFYNRIHNKKNFPQNINVLISILIDIAFKNPRTYPIISAILSKLMSFLNKKAQKLIIGKIQKKFEKIPNTGHLDLWLQRITLKIDKNIEYQETLCKKISGETDIEIWNSEWLNKEMRDIINSIEIVNWKKLKQLDQVIDSSEVSIFTEKEYIY